MAFTVEDGTGVADANAYCEVAFVTEYLTDRNRQTENGWSDATSAAQQAAVIAATDYIEHRFGARYLGVAEFPETPQGLGWPRLGVYDRLGNVVEGVPKKLKQAVAEYAVRAVSGTKLLPDPTVDNSGRSVVEKTENVGPVETTYKYASAAVDQLLRPYPAADRLLAELLVYGGAVIR